MDIKLIPKEYNQKLAASRGFKLPSIKSRVEFNLSYLLKTNLWLGLIIGLLIISILSYLGLIIYKNSLNQENLALSAQIKDREPERDLELEKQLRELKKGVKNLQKFSEIHIYSFRLFQMLEELTLPKVQWINFTADLFENRINLRGQAVNYNILAKEIITLEEDSRIKEVEISGITLDSGGVNFNMVLEFEPSILKGLVQPST